MCVQTATANGLPELTSTESQSLIQLNWIPQLLNEEHHVANRLRARLSEERRTGGKAEIGAAVQQSNIKTI